MAPTKTHKSTKSELLLKIEHIKYRTSGAGRSPVGTLYIYSDYVEWQEQGGPENLTILFSNVKLQRVSAPEKPKVQLQLVMYDDNQATFVFMKPQSETSTLLEDRNLVRDTLQEALIRHRKLTTQNVSTADQIKQVEVQRKEKILNDNPYLKSLYLHLVATKLISPQDFWSQHYRSEDSSGSEIGVSGGFLSSIVQTDGANGVRLNLTTETIQSIFKTYPAVEKKHLELVPHAMTEQEFWKKFFQSHYFHRERNVEVNPNDPFSDCVKMDEKDMKALMQSSHIKKNLDFGYLREDLGLINDIRSNSIPIKESELKALLVKRCNYHSERVLQTIKGPLHLYANGSLKQNGDMPSTSQSNGKAAFELESEELRNLRDAIAEEFAILEMKEHDGSVSSNVYSDADVQRFSAIVKEFSKDDLSQEPSDLLDLIKHQASDVEMLGEDSELFQGLSPNDYRELHAIHGAVFELLKHFWSTFPPVTPELETKLIKMNETLQIYENTQLADASTRFGRRNVEHCYRMIAKAKEKYSIFEKNRSR